MHPPRAKRVVFFGSPEFAVPSLRALLDAGFEVPLVVTQPDRPAGRGRRLTPTPVAALAEQRGLPTWKVSSLTGAEAEARLRAAEADAMALAAFAAYVPRNLLNLSPPGILNVHPSLLPRWRGASPIQSALLAGDTETGVSIIRLAEALDAGPVYLQERVAVGSSEDYLSLEPRLADLGARLLHEALRGVLDGSIQPRPQDERFVTECARIEREDARIDWHLPAELIWRQVRAYRGWPQAFTTWGDSILKVLRAHPISPPPLANPPGAEVAGLTEHVQTPGPGPLASRVRPDEMPLQPVAHEGAATGPGLRSVRPIEMAEVSGASQPAERLQSATPFDPGVVIRLGNDAIGVQTGDHSILALDEVVLTGRSPMTGGELARGFPLLIGTRLGSGG